MDHRCPHCQASLRWRGVRTHEGRLADGAWASISTCPLCRGELQQRDVSRHRHWADGASAVAMVVTVFHAGAAWLVRREVDGLAVGLACVCTAWAVVQGMRLRRRMGGEAVWGRLVR